MPRHSHLLTCFGIHGIFEVKNLLVKMMDGRVTALFILFECFIALILSLRIIHRPLFISTVRKGAGNSDGSESVQSVGVLNDLPLDALHCGLHIFSFEADVVDNMNHGKDGGSVRSGVFQ